MRQNTAKRKTARPRLFAVFFTFWGINGRRTVSFNPARNASHKAIARRIFTFSSILFGLCVWLFPSSALAEMSETQEGLLRTIKLNLDSIKVDVSSIDTVQDWQYSYLVNALGGNMNSGSETPYYVPAIYNQLQQLYKSLGTTEQNTLLSKLTTLEGYSSSLVNNSEDSLDHLQRIEDFLSNIEALLESNSGGSGSGGEGSTENDWVKETTFQEYSDNFQTYYDWVRSSFGFEGGSSESLYDWLNNRFGWNSDAGYTLRSYYYEEGKGNDSPFPLSNSEMSWAILNGNRWTFTNKTFLEVLIDQMESDIVTTGDGFSAVINNQIKSSWNDWYAHTNLVSTLERLLDNSPPENRVDSTSDIGTITQSQNGGEVLNITYDSGTGDSAESIDLTPAYTNNVAQLSTDADDIKKDFDDIWDYNKIKERYVDSEKFKDTSSFQDVQQKEISDYIIQYGNKPYMAFRWSSTALRMYKAIFTYDRMRLLRSTFGRMWNLLVIWGCYVLFRILGKANA